MDYLTRRCSPDPRRLRWRREDIWGDVSSAAQAMRIIVRKDTDMAHVGALARRCVVCKCESAAAEETSSGSGGGGQ